MRCPECGLAYVQGLEVDEEAHARIHDEWVNGSVFTSNSADRVIGIVQGFNLLEASPGSPKDYRQRFWKVALRARRGTEFPTAYDGGDDEVAWDGRAYVLCRENRGVALVVVRLRDTGCWWWPWGDWDAGRCPAEVADTALRRIVDFAWVLPSLQHRGIATEIIRQVAEHLRVDVDDLGWTLDFTPAGERLVRRLTGEGFWATR